jgi:aldose 1-epimerase
VTTTLELFAGPARVVLAPQVGGAIAAYEWNGKAVLRPTPSDALTSGDVQRFSSYPLIPFSNRIADATLHWHGVAHSLPRYLANHPHAIHGNGWRRAWQVVERSRAHATLELVHTAAGESAREWPFAYRARHVFDLADNALSMTLAIENTGAGPFPFGLGWHPFFPRNAATELSFSAAGVWQTDATVMPTRLDPVPSSWDFARPRPIGAVTLDHCFTGWRPPATLRWPEQDLVATISADAAFSYLVVYVPTDRDYLAIEPVTHMTDAFNRADGGEFDTGTRALAPGATFSCTMRLSVSRDSQDARGV